MLSTYLLLNYWVTYTLKCFFSLPVSLNKRVLNKNIPFKKFGTILNCFPAMWSFEIVWKQSTEVNKINSCSQVISTHYCIKWSKRDQFKTIVDTNVYLKSEEEKMRQGTIQSPSTFLPKANMDIINHHNNQLKIKEDWPFDKSPAQCSSVALCS